MQRSVVLLLTSGSVFLHLYIDQYSLLQKHSPYLGKSAFFGLDCIQALPNNRKVSKKFLYWQQ